MIKSAEEFKLLRESEAPDRYRRAAHEEAMPGVWEDVLTTYPELAFWVAQNKTVPPRILEVLAPRQDANVREMVAGKRKLPRTVMERLLEDPDESVRLALARNAKVPHSILERLATDPWQELRKVVQDRLSHRTW